MVAPKMMMKPVERKQSSSLWTWKNALFVIVSLGLVGVVVMMAGGSNSFQQQESSADLMEFINTMDSNPYVSQLESKVPHPKPNKQTPPPHPQSSSNNINNRVLRVTEEPEDFDVGQHRRERMDAYLAERAKCDSPDHPTGWVSIDMDAEVRDYGLKWRQTQEEHYQERYISLEMCEVEDESGESGWVFSRVGPMVGRGGYDWHSGGVQHYPRNPKGKFITAKMFAPVTEEGEILSYPPVHAHHVHMGLDAVQHFLDSHGDSICSEELGGTACYLREEPEGYGFPLLESDKYSLDFMMNDVRALGSPALVFYLEASVRWSSDTTLKPVARANLRMHITNKHPFNTILLPLEDSVIWNTGKWLVDGRVVYSLKDQTPWVHSHRSFLKGEWGFAASPEELGLTQDLLEQTPQDQVPESSTEVSWTYDTSWMPRGQDAEKALFDKIKNSKAGMESLRCWMVPSEEEKTLEFVKGTDTSRAYPEAWQQNWEETWYDRVGQVHCNEWSFRKGDNYTIIAINGVRDELAGSLDKPNLQHVGFKMEYETTGDLYVGPNVEQFTPPFDDYSVPDDPKGHGVGGVQTALYKLPVSYMQCFNSGTGCSDEDRNSFAEWYYAKIAEKGEETFKSCESCPTAIIKLLDEEAEDVLANDYGTCNPAVHVKDNLFKSF
jgi:hypothetical protein